MGGSDRHPGGRRLEVRPTETATLGKCVLSQRVTSLSMKSEVFKLFFNGRNSSLTCRCPGRKGEQGNRAGREGGGLWLVQNKPLQQPLMTAPEGPRPTLKTPSLDAHKKMPLLLINACVLIQRSLIYPMRMRRWPCPQRCWGSRLREGGGALRSSMGATDRARLGPARGVVQKASSLLQGEGHNTATIGSLT